MVFFVDLSFLVRARCVCCMCGLRDFGSRGPRGGSLLVQVGGVHVLGLIDHFGPGVCAGVWSGWRFQFGPLSDERLGPMLVPPLAPRPTLRRQVGHAKGACAP